MRELADHSPQINVNQILNYVSPSFISTPQVLSDGTDHVDPISLRGLGPDQVLVLVNGKRRHTSALIHVTGTPGRGSVGTDLNAIPVAAIERIEILRDGASAQYGSDAIGGVINVVLKKDYNDLNISVHSGRNWGANTNDFAGGTDGADFQANVNYGRSLNKEGGYINLTGSINTRDRTSRSRAYSGLIFHGYNSIEWEAYKNGADLSALPTDLDAIKQYAALVDYFSYDDSVTIANAPNIETIQNLFFPEVVNKDGDTVRELTDFTDEELAARGLSREDFKMNVGQSEYREGKLFVNLALPFGTSTAYAFGGLSHRKSVGFAFYRLPSWERAYTPLHINGFRPEGHTDVFDQSMTVGIENKMGAWNTDLSNTFGLSAFKFVAAHSSNASLQGASGSEFDSWNMKFIQNTTNFDLTRDWDHVFQGVYLALGSEFRIENYQITAGSEDSWGLYDRTGALVRDVNLLPDSLQVVDFFGRPRVGGAQAFPGFRPESAVDAFRQSYAVYADAEFDLSKSFIVELAGRYEHYSDFGSTLNGKVAARLSLMKNLALRGSASTGFRAPSLHQLYFSSVSTLFVGSVGSQVLTPRNNSILARNLGIDPLTQETSRSASAGITYSFDPWGLSISVDGFFTQIFDRVILTDLFTKERFENEGKDDLARYLENADAEKVQFFTNAIDTETMGIEMVVAQKAFLSRGLAMTNNFSLSVFRTEAKDIKASDELAGFEDIYFGERSRIFVEEAMPRMKADLTNVITRKNWMFLLRNTYFGSVTDAGDEEGDDTQEFSGKVITDLSVSYRVSKALSISIGSNNLFDIYPDERRPDLTAGDQFIYSVRVAQFGSNGRYVYTRLNFTL